MLMSRSMVRVETSKRVASQRALRGRGDTARNSSTIAYNRSVDSRGQTTPGYDTKMVEPGLPSGLQAAPVPQRAPRPYGRAVTGVWQAMAGRPHRFLLSRWPLRSLAYLLSSVVVGVALLMALVMGLLFPPAVVFLGLPVGALERLRLRHARPGAGAQSAPVPLPGLGGWLRVRLGEGATWRELGHVLALSSVLLLIDLISLGLLADCVIVVASPAIVAAGVPLQFGGFTIDRRGEAFTVGGDRGAGDADRGVRVVRRRGDAGRVRPVAARAEGRGAQPQGRGAGPVARGGCSTRSRRSGAGSSGTCTTAPSSIWSLLAMTLGLARLELDGDGGPTGTSSCSTTRSGRPGRPWRRSGS